MNCTLSITVDPGRWALLLLLLMPFLARAAAADDDKQMHRIREEYEASRYEKALELVEAAQKSSIAGTHEVTFWLYEGILSYELGENKRADAAIRKALTRQCDAELPVEVSPKITDAIERIRKTIPPQSCSRPNSNPTSPHKPDSPSEHSLHLDPPPPHSSRLQKIALIPAIAGGALVVVGGGFYVASRLNLNRLRNNDPRISSKKDAQLISYQGQTWQILGGGLLGLGAAGLATSAVMYLLGSPQGSSASLGSSTDGTSVFVYGRWP